MSDNAITTKNTSSWMLFTVAAFATAAAMMAGGIFFMDASFAAKGFYAMSAIMLVHTSITITKTLRDNEESERLIHKIDEARTEKLLREIGRSEA
jgi:hypothetical protein